MRLLSKPAEQRPGTLLTDAVNVRKGAACLQPLEQPRPAAGRNEALCRIHADLRDAQGVDKPHRVCRRARFLDGSRQIVAALFSEARHFCDLCAVLRQAVDIRKGLDETGVHKVA